MTIYMMIAEKVTWFQINIITVIVKFMSSSGNYDSQCLLSFSKPGKRCISRRFH